MKKITYKEFEKEVNVMGWNVRGDKYASVICGGTILASVSKECTHVLNLDWGMFRAALSEEEKTKLATLCWRLASTPLGDREEPKKYYLKVCQKYLPFFSSDYEYLNININTGRMVVSTEYRTRLYKTFFTEEEINELAKEHDLSLFEKVEVEDEELEK